MRSFYTTSCLIIQITVIVFLVPFQSKAEHINADPYSIVFIIDNSGSNSGTSGTDPSGQRFIVTKELLDYIYQKAPETKVGLVLFGSRLWFYHPDNATLFVSVPKDQYHDGNGCYMQPLDLNEKYSGTAAGFGGGTISYDTTGLDILKMYLETEPGPMGGEETKYTPTHKVNYPFVAHDHRLTNITRAFDAANQAYLHQTPQLEKSRHVTIFFSDGLATLESTSPEYPYLNDYVKGENTPSTFTVFYNSSTSDLAKLEQMTENIKNNGYSEKNAEITDLISLSNWETVKEKLKELFDGLNTGISSPFQSKSNGIQILTKWVSPNEVRITSPENSLRVDIFTMHGRKIQSLYTNGQTGNGSQVTWDTHDSNNHEIPSGTYYLAVRSGEDRVYRPLVVVR